MVQALNYRPRKRLFILLLLASLVLVTLSLYGFWRLSFAGLFSISQYLPLIMVGVLSLAMLLFTVGIFCVITALVGVRTLPFLQSLAWTAVNALFPIVIMLGRLLDIDKERVERSFIEVSNQLVREKRVKVSADRLLLLLPHCLQLDTCPHKITRQVQNCRRCGRCQIGSLLKLAEKYGIHIAVVTGGTLARKVVQTVKPQAVLAVACERDLTSGIQDIFPLPVVGILNERPEGPCLNTCVNLPAIEKNIIAMLADKEEK